MCSGGGTGRRVWLRSIWSNPWGFKSPLEYHFYSIEGAVFEDALMAQSVEHILGKDEVTGSSPVEGSIFEGKSFLNLNNNNILANSITLSGGKNG